MFKIYGDQGVIDLTRWRTPTYSRAGAIKPSEAPKEETPGKDQTEKKPQKHNDTSAPDPHATGPQNPTGDPPKRGPLAEGLRRLFGNKQD